MRRRQARVYHSLPNRLSQSETHDDQSKNTGARNTKLKVGCCTSRRRRRPSSGSRVGRASACAGGRGVDAAIGGSGTVRGSAALAGTTCCCCGEEEGADAGRLARCVLFSLTGCAVPLWALRSTLGCGICIGLVWAWGFSYESSP